MTCYSSFTSQRSSQKNDEHKQGGYYEKQFSHWVR